MEQRFLEVLDTTSLAFVDIPGCAKLASQAGQEVLIQSFEHLSSGPLGSPVGSPR